MYISLIDLDFLLWSAWNCKNCIFSDNLWTITEDGIIIFSFTFSAQTACNIHFWIWKYSKLIFMCSPLWSILFCKIPQFLAKSYRFGQLTILFLKVDTLRLLKIYITFCPPARAKHLFFRLQLMDYIGINSLSAVLFIINWTMTSSYCQISYYHSKNPI